MAADVLVLKHQAISIHNTDSISIIPDWYHKSSMSWISDEIEHHNKFDSSLTHWPPGEVAVILEVWFPDSLYRIVP